MLLFPGQRQVGTAGKGESSGEGKKRPEMIIGRMLNGGGQSESPKKKGLPKPIHQESGMKVNRHYMKGGKRD